MGGIKVTKIDNSIEDLIVTGMIVDTVFYRKTKRATNPMYFKEEQARILAIWVHEYAEYNEDKAPKEEIREIFDIHINDLAEDERSTIRLFLKRILTTYAGREFNSQYIIQKAMPYLKMAAYAYRADLMQLYIKKNDIVKCDEIWNNAKVEIFRETTTIRNASDTDFIDTWWWKRKTTAMTFQDSLGRYMPNIFRGKLYAMLGPTKRGKSWWLQEWAVNGVIDGLQTVVFSLEMTDEETDERLATRLSAKEIMIQKKKNYLIPVIDCEYNQSGLCQRKECKSPETVVRDAQKNILKTYEECPEHIPCTYCRDKELDFKPCHWLVEETISRLTNREAKKYRREFADHYGKDGLQLISFPIGTADVSDVEKALDDLTRDHGFIADLIIIDYADIMKKDNSKGELRFQLRDIWEELSRLAKTRNCIVVTATQGNRQSIYKDRLTAEDVAEDISKVMTIDGIFGINERGHGKESIGDRDRYWKVQRIETLALRYGDFLEGHQCVCLTDRARGQVCIDSYIERL